MSVFVFGSLTAKERRQVCGGVVLGMAALRFVSCSGSRADTLGLGAAWMDVAVARTRAEIDAVFILLE